MNPDEGLEQQLSLARLIEWVLGRGTPEANAVELVVLAEGLVRQVRELDQWIRSGGYLPKPWSKGRLVRGFGVKEYEAQLRCHDCGGANPQDYAVKREVWNEAWPDYRKQVSLALNEYGRDHPGRHQLLCFSCIEKRLGRALVPGDFLKCPLNDKFLPERYHLA